MKYKSASDWLKRAPVEEIVEVILAAGPHRAAEISSGVLTGLSARYGQQVEGAMAVFQSDPVGSAQALLSVLSSRASSRS